MSTIDRFDNDTVVHALAAGEGLGILCALAHGPFEGARDALSAGEIGLSWDKGDPYGSAMSALGTVVDLLSAWESPAWGNVSGRYDSTGHRLTAEDWAALGADTFADRDDDGVPLNVGALDAPDPWQMQLLYDYLTESDSHLAHVVHLGDMLSQVIDRCRENGRDY